ncbi:ammonium transporter [Mangrovibrevibacter kandeliae]|uniref:ammonium transporter n=1 Tax=Mangrovibrevibacter kandeliae TaxID=2968473 RepID=UPI0021193D71|nr:MULTISPECIES: ammonium transporter [unclassified Aurantimonas]MCQ8781964.1 ammonium transporter [Aurantimonas sp. CSK15Z-1]MCW4115377.1 ammonium transporter [Aurantimonas sp. MSK8Z-1]
MRLRNLLYPAGLLAGLAVTAAFAQDATPPVADATAAAPAPTLDGGDTAWMMTSSLLVLFMTLPGLALFYGGLVRAKNMLSVLMQCTLITGLVMVIWVLWGYSFAFGGSESAWWGGTGKLFLSGVTKDSLSGTIPEYVFCVFQMTFAVITPALIIGSFAERVKFTGVLLFVALWVTFVYFPIAHMVWDANGFLFQQGAMDFAGGTVVHINAGIAALIGCFFVGKRTGLGKDIMAPHSMTLTMVGASILWVGWFGFNAGSALAANGTAGLAMINTFVATAAAILSWSAVEGLGRGKASMLGAASGMVAGLVAITPACGFVGPMGAVILGLIVSPVCYFFVSVVKNAVKYDDSLDVFGVHGIGGMVGAILTGVLASPSFGGVGYAEGQTMAGQLFVQIEGVVITIVWCGVGSIIFYAITKAVTGLRPTIEEEREGLDLTYHGEAAYHS